MSREDLAAALKTLSEAHGPKALASAFASLQRTVTRHRATDRATHGTLSTTIMAALALRDELKAAGATGEALEAGFRDVVRQSWPFTREWHYLCDECRDYGLKMRDCDGRQTCGRREPHQPHEFGEPCWCKAGAKFQKREQTAATAVESAARVSKPTRFGR